MAAIAEIPQMLVPTAIRVTSARGTPGSLPKPVTMAIATTIQLITIGKAWTARVDAAARLSRSPSSTTPHCSTAVAQRSVTGRASRARLGHSRAITSPTITAGDTALIGDFSNPTSATAEIREDGIAIA